MKIFFRFFTIFILISATVDLYSQTPRNHPRLRERMTEATISEIGRSLPLNQATLDRFRPLYKNYQKEIAGINFRESGQLMHVNPDTLTAEGAEEMVMIQLKNARKMISLREKYYAEFKSVLTPQQIIRLYQTEADIRRKVMQESRRRAGARPYRR